MLKNVAGQSIGAQMLNQSTGAAFGGTVTVYVTGDAGVQAIGEVGSGVCTAEGNGYYSYLPTQDETNFDLIAFTFVGSNAIPTTVQVHTLTVAQAAALAAIPPAGAPSYSATDLGTRALRLLGVIDPTETPEAEDIQTAFLALNDMVDNWGTQRQTIHTIERTAFALVASQASYSLGTGGDWDIVRPVWIEGASVVPNVGDPVEVPIGRPIDFQHYQAIPQKQVTSSFPDRIYWDRAWTSGLSRVYVYPVPDNSNAAVILYTPTALIRFADLATQYTFPPGFAKALRYGLAVELAAEYGLDPPSQVSRIAMQSMADIKRANFAPLEARFDSALVGPRRRYNIYTDA